MAEKWPTKADVGASMSRCSRFSVFAEQRTNPPNTINREHLHKQDRLLQRRHQVSVSSRRSERSVATTNLSQQPRRHIHRPRQSNQLQTFCKRTSPPPRQPRRRNQRRPAHPRAANDQCRHVQSHHLLNTTNRSLQQPRRIARTIDQRKTAIDQFPRDRQHRLVISQVNKRNNPPHPQSPPDREHRHDDQARAMFAEWNAWGLFYGVTPTDRACCRRGQPIQRAMRVKLMQTSQQVLERRGGMSQR